MGSDYVKTVNIFLGGSGINLIKLKIHIGIWKGSYQRCAESSGSLEKEIIIWCLNIAIEIHRSLGD